MKRGGNILCSVAVLAMTACTGSSGKLEIRSIATPLAAGQRPVPFRIAEARAQFALGNVGLALEAFRIALREDPNSIDAMTGIAACYDRMARFDLSRRHYEAALAIAPADTQLLTAFAGSLALQGRSAEASAVRNEIAQRLALAKASRLLHTSSIASQSPTRVGAGLLPQRALEQRRQATPIKPTKMAKRAPAPAKTAPAPTPVRTMVAVPAASAPAASAAAPALGRSVTIALPPAKPQPAEAPVKPAVKAAVRSAAPPAPPTPIAVTAAAPKPAVKAAVQTAAPAALPALPTPVAVAVAPPKPTVDTAVRVAPPPVADQSAALPAAPSAVTLALRPTARTGPVRAEPVIASTVKVALPPARPAAVAPPSPPPVTEPVQIARSEPVAEQRPAAKAGPRIERRSLLEVALITTPEPKWRALTVRRTERSATVRFVPLRQASLTLSGIRILNAARVNRLAARTRSYLVGRGWSPMIIGNAAQARTRSVIFYPPHRRRTAQRLSAQFGFVIAQRPGTRQITVLLGRDAVRIPALRTTA